jgi:REP element-mobilizing transposase RayT
LFHDDADRQCYLRLVAEEVRRRDWSVLTFCLMTNPVHFLVRTPGPDLADGFKRIHEAFAQAFNSRHRRGGHVFGGRFYSRVVRSDRHLIGCLRYIGQNPVRHGACRQARDWVWSAHRALAGLATAPAFLDVEAAYSYLGADGGSARTNYLRLVSQSDDTLLANMASGDSDEWLLTALEDFAITSSDLAAFLRVSLRTAQRRVAAARVAAGSVPSATGGVKGTGPETSAEG